MSTTGEIAETKQAALSPILDSRFALQWPDCLAVLGWVVFFLMVSYLPLHHAITWQHVEQGAAMLSDGQLATEPAGLPLAGGMRWFASSWLGDLALAATFRAGGGEALSCLLAVSFAVLALATWRVGFLQTRSVLLAAAATLAVLAFHWSRLSALRPELWGAVCLTLLLGVLIRREATARWSDWIIAPALLAAWANLDGSVVFGMLAVFGWLLGTAVDQQISRRGESVSAPPSGSVSGNLTRNHVLLAELTLAATLCQPQGLDLWADLVSGSVSVIWRTLGGSQPLSLISWTAAGCLLLWALAAVCLRWSPRPVRSREVLWFATGSLLVAWNFHWGIWFGPLVVFSLLPHVAATIERAGGRVTRRPRSDFEAGKAVPVGTFAFTLVAVLLVWIGFALSPSSRPVLGGKARKTTQLHDHRTPLFASAYLKEHPAEGLVWTPPEWGDWIGHAAGAPVIANSQAAFLPKQVQFDLAQVYQGLGNWTKTLDRYRADVLVLDKKRHSLLWNAALADSADWQIVRETINGAVLKRKGA